MLRVVKVLGTKRLLVSGLQDEVLGNCSAAGEGTGHVHLLQKFSNGSLGAARVL